MILTSDEGQVRPTESSADIKVKNDVAQDQMVVRPAFVFLSAYLR